MFALQSVFSGFCSKINSSDSFCGTHKPLRCFKLLSCKLSKYPSSNADAWQNVNLCNEFALTPGQCGQVGGSNQSIRLMAPTIAIGHTSFWLVGFLCYCFSRALKTTIDTQACLISLLTCIYYLPSAFRLSRLFEQQMKR